MMKFKYVGSGDTPPKKTVFMGYEFELGGNAVEVERKHAIAKLENIPCFEAVKVDEEAAKKAEAEAKKRAEDEAKKADAEAKKAEAEAKKKAA